MQSRTENKEIQNEELDSVIDSATNTTEDNLYVASLFMKKLSDAFDVFADITKEEQMVLNEISSLKITSSRGTLANYLLSFATSGTWNVYAQQYNNKKAPFLIEKNILQAKCFIYYMVNKEEDLRQKKLYIRAFQYLLVSVYADFEENNEEYYDFHSAWKGLCISWKGLKKNPLKYDSTWTHFFTNPKNVKSIDRLIDDITVVLGFRKRLEVLEDKKKLITKSSKLIAKTFDKFKSSILNKQDGVRNQAKDFIHNINVNSVTEPQTISLSQFKAKLQPFMDMATESLVDNSDMESLEITAEEANDMYESLQEPIEEEHVPTGKGKFYAMKCAGKVKGKHYTEDNSDSEEDSEDDSDSEDEQDEPIATVQSESVFPDKYTYMQQHAAKKRMHADIDISEATETFTNILDNEIPIVVTQEPNTKRARVEEHMNEETTTV